MAAITAQPDSDSPAVAPILARMKKPRDVIQPRWGVFALRKKAERLGSVLARDERKAIERALQECAAGERDRWRISVRREA
jgi:hypothetical protein